MVLQRAALAGRQDTLEVVGHELDELDARNVAGRRRSVKSSGHHLVAKVALERGADLRARAVQEHALVAVRDPEQLTDLVGVPARRHPAAG